MFGHFDVGSPAYRAMRSSWIASVAAVLAACHRPPAPTIVRPAPVPSVQVGACARPDRDGVLGSQPRIVHADKDLNGDGVADAIVADRSLCTAEDNCYWNVFVMPPAGSGDCTRYAGTFEAHALEPMTAVGDENMADVRGYWNLHGGRFLLQSYRFLHGGYRIVEALVCKRERDDRVECADAEH